MKYTLAYPGSRRALASALAVAGLLALGACSSTTGAGEVSPSGNPVESPDRDLRVAFSSYMPYSGLDSSKKATGLDGDIITAVAEKLDYTIKPNLMDFSGVLASVQTGRADVAIGDIFWNTERAATGLFTDPPYYSGFVVIQRPETSIGSIDDLNGKTIGDDVGSAYLKAEKAIPGATLKVFPTSDAVLQALQNGQIDVYLGTPLIAAYTSRTNPDIQLHEVPFTPPTQEQLAAHPEFEAFKPAMTGFFVAKEATTLVDELNGAIRSLYADGTLSQIVEKWGGDPNEFLNPTPGMAEQRIGVDRPAGWQPPSLTG